MSFTDVKALIEVEQERQKNTFIETEDLNAYLVKIQSNAEFIIHYASGQCAGFVAFYCNDTTKDLAFITLVLLAPQFRGRGLAKSLINYTLDYCRINGFKKCGLNVRKDNHSAINLYESCGFEVKSENNEKLLMVVTL